MQVPVFVDSPLAISATEIFKKNMDLFEDEVKEKIERGDNPLEFPGLQFTRTAEESKELNMREGSSIIISASGMCEVGRIKHHLKHNLWNPNNTILFVGYQAPGTLGRTIVDGAEKVKIFGEEIAVEARVEYIEGYSGHADQQWLLNFVYSFTNQPKYIFLVHGEEEGQIALKEKIEETAEIPVIIPSLGETYTLDENVLQTIEHIHTEKPYKVQYLRLGVLEQLEKIKDEINDMESIVKEEKLLKETNDEDIIRLSEKIKELERQIVRIIE